VNDLPEKLVKNMFFRLLIHAYTVVRDSKQNLSFLTMLA